MRSPFVRRAALILLPAVCLGLALPMGPGAARLTAHAAVVARTGRHATPFALPVSFEPNRGQAAPEVRYLGRGPGFTALFTAGGVALSLAHRSTIRLTFPGTGRPSLTAAARQPGIVNYFIGNDPNRWLTRIPTFGRITYHGVYPGIDLIFQGQAGRLEYQWLIRPHASPAHIAMAVDGGRGLRLESSGDLVITTALGSIAQTRPRAFQVIHGRRVAVTGGFRLHGSRRIGFGLGHYDASVPLVIDPATVLFGYSTYFGGNAAHQTATGVAVDSTGNVYLSGSTDGVAPATPGAFQPTAPSASNGYVAKLNPIGTTLLYCTYIGGTNDDFARAIAVDAAGDAYVTGQTGSPDFPGARLATEAKATSRATINYYGDFVLKLNPTGSSLLYSHVEFAARPIDSVSIAVDPTGHAFYAGTRTLAGPGPAAAAFVSELNPDGSPAQTYQASGSNIAGGLAVAVDGADNVYLAGWTTSPDFPLVNPYQSSFGGGEDAFLLKLDAGWNVLFSTFLGGRGTDEAHAVAVDTLGNAYLAGYTSSPNFPTVAALQGSLAGSVDGFAAEVSASGRSLVYSTYLGGHESGAEYLDAVAVDPDGNAFVAGESTATDYPLVKPFAQPGTRGDDAVVSEIGPRGTSLEFSSYLGGSNQDSASAIAVMTNDAVYVAGQTFSTDFYTTSGAYQRTAPRFPSAAFIVRFSVIPPTPTPPPHQATFTPTSIATAVNTPVVVPAPTATYTPIPTPSPQPSPVIRLPPTPQPTATFPLPPTPVPTFGRNLTPGLRLCPGDLGPPQAPDLTVNPVTIRAHRSFVVTVRTLPRYSVTVTVLTSFAIGRIWRQKTSGVADNAGGWRKKLTLDYPHLGPPLKATLLAVVASCAGKSATNSRLITIVPEPSIPRVSVSPLKILPYHQLRIFVRADPHVTITVNILPGIGTPRHYNFKFTLEGTANDQGLWVGLVQINVTPTTAIKAEVRVYATNPAGSSVTIPVITILPQARPAARGIVSDERGPQ